MVAFHGQIRRGTYHILVARMQDKGRRVRQLTWEGNNEDPSWAPDGRHLVFVRFKSVNGDPVVHGDLVTSRWDGTDRHRIVNGPLFDFRPDWGRVPS